MQEFQRVYIDIGEEVELYGFVDLKELRGANPRDLVPVELVGFSAPEEHRLHETRPKYSHGYYEAKKVRASLQGEPGRFTDLARQMEVWDFYYKNW